MFVFIVGPQIALETLFALEIDIMCWVHASIVAVQHGTGTPRELTEHSMDQSRAC